jgi:hypothetical protein
MTIVNQELWDRGQDRRGNQAARRASRSIGLAEVTAKDSREYALHGMPQLKECAMIRKGLRQRMTDQPKWHGIRQIDALLPCPTAPPRPKEGRLAAVGQVVQDADGDVPGVHVR